MSRLTKSRGAAGTTRAAFALLLALVVGPVNAVVWAAQIHNVSQKGRMFQAREIDIARGDTIRFSNDDEFLHQIYVKSPSFTFESDEQAPGQSIDVRFPEGTFEVRCRIHPKMLLVVHAK